MKEGFNFLADLEDVLNHSLGFPQGTEALKSLCEKHHGAEVYIPSATEAFVAYRNKRIREKFNGSNYAALAAEEDLSERNIRRIINGKD